MKKINHNSKLQFQKVNIARLSSNDLGRIRGGESEPTEDTTDTTTTDSVSFTVIRSSFKCLFSVTTSG
ncbi:class I lanthipeptide [Dokdonia ponticola]|uniref:Class I lanthipeptide n=1 Tax=Dokdonia ponticola TaxID=2041041 RepID=A0ABV9I108_9FLAO